MHSAKYVDTAVYIANRLLGKPGEDIKKIEHLFHTFSFLVNLSGSLFRYKIKTVHFYHSVYAYCIYSIKGN